MIIISHHRSLDLADRKRHALLLKYASVELLSRRDAAGRYSSRGRTYIWEVRPKEKKPKRAEFVIHFEYGAKSKKKGDQRIRFQVHVFGPSGASFDDAIKAIRKRNQGEAWPEGWSKKAIYWTKPRQPDKHRTDPLPSHLRQVAIAAGGATPVSKNLPTGGKRK